MNASEHLLYPSKSVQSAIWFTFQFPTKTKPITMPQVTLREKGQVTIPAELLQQWSREQHVAINDSIEVNLSNGVLMLIPSKRQEAKRDFMSFAGVAKNLWGTTHEETETAIRELRNTWTR